MSHSSLTALNDRQLAQVLGGPQSRAGNPPAPRVSKATPENGASQARSEAAELLWRTVNADSLGVCLVDETGMVRAANARCQSLLGVRRIRGRLLAEYFSGTDRSRLELRLTASQGKGSLIELGIERHRASSKRLAAQVVALHDAPDTWHLVFMTDVSEIVNRQLRVFEKAALGIMIVDREGILRYSNPTMREWTGVPPNGAFPMSDLVADHANLSVLESHLRERPKGRSTTYLLNMRSFRFPGKAVQLELTGIPYFDIEGKHAGSVGIARNRDLDVAAERIHRAIAEERDGKKLLAAVRDAVQEVVPFYDFIISRFDAGCNYGRADLWFTAGDREYRSIRRWHLMSPAQRAWILEKKFVFDNDMRAFLNRPEWRDLLEEPSVKDMLSKGVNAFLRIPVRAERNLVAQLSLTRQGTDKFSEADLQALQRLPIEQAILASIHREENDDLKFRLSLLSQITKADSVEVLGRLLVEQIGKHFEWSHVSLLKVNGHSDDGTLNLFQQWAPPANRKIRLKYNYSQKVTEGLLGWVVENKVLFNCPDVHEEPRYKAGIPSTRSELCVPILTDGDVRWILNVEDDRLHAFSDGEAGLLKDLAEEAGSAFARIADHILLRRSLELSSDYVLLINGGSRIVFANPTTNENLGGNRSACLTGSPLSDLIADSADLKRLTHGAAQGLQVQFRGKDGTQIPLLVSAGELEGRNGVRMLIGKDLSLLERVAALEAQQKAAQTIASQTQVPLGLVLSWLRQARDMCTDRNLGEYILKTLSQLGKLRGVYDRLAFYDSDSLSRPVKIRFDLANELSQIVKELPQAEQERIGGWKEQPSIQLSADLFQIRFVLECILSYLLRFLPADRSKTVQVRIDKPKAGNGVAKTNGVDVWIEGYEPRDLKRSLGEETWRLYYEMSLAEPLIKTIVETGHKGRYLKKKQRSGEVQFSLVLPEV